MAFCPGPDWLRMWNGHPQANGDTVLKRHQGLGYSPTSGPKIAITDVFLYLKFPRHSGTVGAIETEMTIENS